MAFINVSDKKVGDDGPKAASQAQYCSKCLLSSLDTPDFSLGAQGTCNYCEYYERSVAALGPAGRRNDWITQKLDRVRKDAAGRQYDCILGVSGGVDSSYLAMWAHRQGMRPLVIHVDNGWNSELAVKNIQTLCEKLGFALQTYVINWEEFKQLQLAYLRAGVIDIEALTDHAIYAALHITASKHGIRHILSGTNYSSELIMPKSWVFDKTDFTNIRDINRRFGKGGIRSFPHVTFAKKMWYARFLKIESIQVLNYIRYNKKEAKSLLINELGWLDYGGKHYESVFTKFYQAYILPVKFGVDKRKAHLSNLICSGQITKEEACQELKKPLYDPAVLKQEKEYVLKKLGMPEAEFDRLMLEKPRKHTDFKTQQKLWNSYFRLIKILRPWKK